MHTQIGGSWDCPFSLESFLESSPSSANDDDDDDDNENDFDDTPSSSSSAPSQSSNPNDPLAAARSEFLALNAINLWKIGAAEGLVECPASCSADASFAECRCQCDLDTVEARLARLRVRRSRSRRKSRERRRRRRRRRRTTTTAAAAAATTTTTPAQVEVDGDAGGERDDSRRPRVLLASVSDLSGLSAAEVYDLLDDARIFEFLQNPAEAAEFLSWEEEEEEEEETTDVDEEDLPVSEDDGSFEFRFTGLDKADNDAMMRALLEVRKLITIDI